jgi:hypothetical protein
MFHRFICITSRPAGEAPEAIREKWTGLVLPVQRELIMPHADVVGRRLKGDRRVGYEVRWDDALRLLGAKHPDARDWWKDNAHGAATLFFEDSCCKAASDFEL